MEDNRENRLDIKRKPLYYELQAVLLEAFEDHLGVALIQSGGSRYEQMKWQEDCDS